MKLLLYLMSAFLIVTTAYAATTVSTGKATVALPRTTTQSISQAEADMRVSQTQIATMKEYHSSLLDTVYWALGTLATVATLLVGFGWFANFKFHEAEKQRLKEDLVASQKEASAKLEAQLSLYQAEVIKLVDARLDAYLTRINRDIDVARGEAFRSTQENADALKQLKVTVATLQENEKKNTKRDSALETSLRLVEEEVWEIKGVPSNILLTQTQGLRSAIDAENQGLVKFILGRMQTTIKTHILRDKIAIWESTLEDIEKLLTEVEKKEPILTSEVRELVKQIQSRPD